MSVYSQLVGSITNAPRHVSHGNLSGTDYHKLTLKQLSALVKKADDGDETAIWALAIIGTLVQHV